MPESWLGARPGCAVVPRPPEWGLTCRSNPSPSVHVTVTRSAGLFGEQQASPIYREVLERVSHRRLRPSASVLLAHTQALALEGSGAPRRAAAGALLVRSCRRGGRPDEGSRLSNLPNKKRCPPRHRDSSLIHDHDRAPGEDPSPTTAGSPELQEADAHPPLGFPLPGSELKGKQGRQKRDLAGRVMLLESPQGS